MKNMFFVPVVVAVVFAAVGFAGGLTYQKNKDSLAGVSPQDLPQKLQSLGLNTGFGRNGTTNGAANFRTGRRGGPGAVTGQIISKDDQSITVKQNDGSTKIIYFSGSTTVGNFTPGSTTDLTTGKQVTANGTPNSDGSLSAQNIQIRPAQSTSQS